MTDPIRAPDSLAPIYPQSVVRQRWCAVPADESARSSTSQGVLGSGVPGSRAAGDPLDHLPDPLPPLAREVGRQAQARRSRERYGQPTFISVDLYYLRLIQPAHGLRPPPSPRRGDPRRRESRARRHDRCASSSPPATTPRRRRSLGRADQPRANPALVPSGLGRAAARRPLSAPGQRRRRSPRCEPPTQLAVTWEYGGDVSWVTVTLAPTGGGRRGSTLQHVAHVDRRAGPVRPRCRRRRLGHGLAGSRSPLASRRPWSRRRRPRWFVTEAGKGSCARQRRLGRAPRSRPAHPERRWPRRSGRGPPTWANRRRTADARVRRARRPGAAPHPRPAGRRRARLGRRRGRLEREFGSRRRRCRST